MLSWKEGPCYHGAFSLNCEGDTREPARKTTGVRKSLPEEVKSEVVEEESGQSAACWERKYAVQTPGTGAGLVAREQKEHLRASGQC